MTKIWLVARREFITNLRRPAFLIAAFGAPLFTVVLMMIVFSLVVNQQTSDALGQIAYVDLSGVLADAVDRPSSFVPYTDEAAASAALEDGTVGAYFVVAANYMNNGEVRFYSRSRLPEDLSKTLDDFLLANVRHHYGDRDLFERITSTVDMTVEIQDSGRTLDQSAAAGLMIMPMIFALVFFLATQTSSSYLMSGVAEEKANRVMEILVTSVKPLELLMGKVLGLGALGLMQLLVWLAAGLLFVNLGSDIDFLQGITIPPDLIIVTLVYFLLSYFMYAGILGAVGAVAGSEQESRQIAGIVTIVGIVPFFFISAFIFDPNGTLVTALTLIPFTAPLSVILRMSLSTVPSWQLIASIVILLATTVLALWGGARIFRWSMLMYGKRPGLRDIWRAARGTTGSGMGTSATPREQGA